MEIKWFAIMVIVLFTSMLAFFVLDGLQQSTMMHDCVSADKDWVHVRGDIYECR